MLKTLLLAYIFFLPFVKLFYWPVVYAKIQANELLFLATLPVIYMQYRKQEKPLCFSSKEVIAPFIMLIISLLFYGCINLASGIYSADIDAILEGLGRNYLLIVMLLMTYFSYQEGEVGLEIAMGAWFWGAMVMAIITYIGYLLVSVGYPNRMVAVIGNYPYFGTVYRAAGLTGGSGMLVLVLTVPTLYAWQRCRTNEWPFIAWGSLFLILLLTLSKEVVLVILGLAMVDPLWKKIPRFLQFMTIAGTAIFFWLATHFLFLPQQDINNSYLNNTQFTNEKVLWQNTEYQVVETSYTALKKAGLSVAWKHPWIGVGPGQFSKKLPTEKQEGIYPMHLPDYDPHSTWMGAFSETGILGLGALILMIGCIISLIRSLCREYHQNTSILTLKTYLLLLLIASVSVDAMNFRHLWVPLGLLIGSYMRHSQKFEHNCTTNIL